MNTTYSLQYTNLLYLIHSNVMISLPGVQNYF